MDISDTKQLGKKIGKHASDFGYDPQNMDDRMKVIEMIRNIHSNPDSVKIGEWRGQKDNVLFYIKGMDVVVTKQSGEFITIMKGASSNVRIKNARNK